MMISSTAYMVTEISVCITWDSSSTKEGIMAAHAGRINRQVNSNHYLLAVFAGNQVLYAFPGIDSYIRSAVSPVPSGQ
jgi:hypothetical protein